MLSPQEVAATIKAFVKVRGVTLKQMLSDCQLSINTLSSMQSGSYYPRLETIVRIADYLDISVNYLLGRTSTSTEDIDMKLYNRIKILPNDTKKWLMDTLDRLEGKK